MQKTRKRKRKRRKKKNNRKKEEARMQKLFEPIGPSRGHTHTHSLTRPPTPHHTTANRSSCLCARADLLVARRHHAQRLADRVEVKAWPPPQQQQQQQQQQQISSRVQCDGFWVVGGWRRLRAT
jgi:hypothetical protein